MNRRNTFDPERIAQINERIRETFDFARDVIDDPTILDDMPDVADIDLRNVTVDSHTYHIVAYRSKSDPDRWVARTTGRTNVGKHRDRHFWISIRLESNVSAEAAMDTVESALRAAEESEQVSHRIA